MKQSKIMHKERLKDMRIQSKMKQQIDAYVKRIQKFKQREKQLE